MEWVIFSERDIFHIVMICKMSISNSIYSQTKSFFADLLKLILFVQNVLFLKKKEMFSYI